MRIRLLLLLAFVLSVFSLKAQDYKVLSMESLPLDMTAREHIKQDERGRQCAVLRISTQRITPEERQGFHFECDYASFAVERQMVEGEVWVWVSPGLKTLKIKHAQLGNVELHTANYGLTIEPLHVYKIVLQGTMTSNNEVVQQYLAFQISPTDAELEVDGEIWPLSSRGTARRRVNEGTYQYKVTALDCEDVENTVTVADSAVVVSVTLKPVSKKPVNQQPAAQTSQPKIEQPKVEQPTPQKTVGSAFFVMANAAYSLAPQASFGLTVGSVKKLGWYASLGSNFKFVKAEYECDYEGNISGLSSEYSYSGQKHTSRLGATAGMVFRIYDPLYAYVGGGYGFRNVFWQLENGSWAKCTDDSYQGIAIDAGLMLHFKGFGFSLGMQTMGVKYLEAKIGIGYTLKRY
jgi:opacity protein-like surface antigen